MALHSGYSLYFDPGVEVKFSAGGGFFVRGNLMAEGTDVERIKFTSAILADHWPGITIQNDVGGRATLRFVVISYASTALSVVCCGGCGPIEIYDGYDEGGLGIISYQPILTGSVP